MPKFYASVSASFDTGNKPCMVAIASDLKAPESIRGKTVTGRANFHGYQGLVSDESGKTVWRGRTHEAPNMYGTVTVGGTTYNGSVPDSTSRDREAMRAAEADAKAEAARMSAAKKAVLAASRKGGTAVTDSVCPGCGGPMKDGECASCGGGTGSMQSAKGGHMMPMPDDHEKKPKKPMPAMKAAWPVVVVG